MMTNQALLERTNETSSKEPFGKQEASLSKDFGFHPPQQAALGPALVEAPEFDDDAVIAFSIQYAVERAEAEDPARAPASCGRCAATCCPRSARGT